MNREKLKRIKNANPEFYEEFVNHFLTNPLTLQGLDDDLYKALQSITGVKICADKADPTTLYVIKSQKDTMDVRLGVYDNDEEVFDYVVSVLRGLRILGV